MHELGLLDEFLKRPHQESGLAGRSATTRRACRFLASADALPLHRPHAAVGFSRFCCRGGGGYPKFSLRMEAEVTDLVEDGGTVVGVRATVLGGRWTFGRSSWSAPTAATRRCATSAVWWSRTSAAMDVLWMRLSSAVRRTVALGRIHAGHMLSDLPRRLLAMRLHHPERRDRGDSAPGPRRVPQGHRGDQSPFSKRVPEIRSWDGVQLLTVGVDRLSAGTGPACSVSGTRRTPCLRSAASVSTLPFRTLSPPPIFSPCRSRQGRDPAELLARCRGGGKRPRA